MQVSLHSLYFSLVLNITCQMEVAAPLPSCAFSCDWLYLPLAVLPWSAALSLLCNFVHYALGISKINHLWQFWIILKLAKDWKNCDLSLSNQPRWILSHRLEPLHWHNFQLVKQNPVHTCTSGKRQNVSFEWWMNYRSVPVWLWWGFTQYPNYCRHWLPTMLPLYTALKPTHWNWEKLIFLRFR